MKHTLRTRAAILLGVGGFALIASFLLSSEGGTWLRDLLAMTHIIWEKPRVFGAFHLWHILLCVVCTVLLTLWCCRRTLDTLDRVVFGAGVLLLIMELYKQWYSFFILYGRFDWGFFPFQFCSLPLYLYLLVPNLKEGRVKDAFYSFLALYGVMGGCLVMGYPAWFEELSLCVHTMLWHTVMISVGVCILFARNYGRRYLSEMLPATAIFLSSVLIATILNVCLVPFTQSSPKPLNLYYMSPYHRPHFFLVRDAWDAFGWWGAMLCYILLFIFVGATLVWCFVWGIHALAKKMDLRFFKKN